MQSKNQRNTNVSRQARAARAAEHAVSLIGRKRDFYKEKIMNFENIIVEVEDGIEYITLNRPQVLNALNIDTVSELRDAIEYAYREAEVKCVIIKGAGDRAFAAGADIAEIHALTPQGGREMIANGQALMCEIEKLPKPVIAALNGYVIGGGLELALACDIRVANDNVQFSFPEPTLGIIPGYGGSQRLGRVIGFGMAKYYCLTEERITAERAYELGLVGKLCRNGEAFEEAKRLAEAMIKRCPESNAAIKEVMREGMNENIDTALEIEKKAFDKLFSAPARTERMGIFLENQKKKKKK